MDYLLSELMFNVIYQRITIQQIYIALCGFDCHWFAYNIISIDYDKFGNYIK